MKLLIIVQQASFLPLAQTLDHILSGLDLAFPDLTGPERQDLQESHGFLGLLVACDVLYDHLCFAVLGDDQRLPVFIQLSYNFGGIVAACRWRTALR